MYRFTTVGSSDDAAKTVQNQGMTDTISRRVHHLPEWGSHSFWRYDGDIGLFVVSEGVEQRMGSGCRCRVGVPSDHREALRVCETSSSRAVQA